MGVFEVRGNHFILNGKPIQILSGAIHYFRVVPEYWRDRLLKLKACGLNTLETYIPWNLHEPKEGEFSFEGIADIERFIGIADELGLYVIIRPSPYICAEWEFGGLPSWLLAEEDMRLRCFHKPFLDKIDAYYDVLMPKLKPYLITNGGPIIAMQIENEYGSYGDDKLYLSYLKDGMIKRGIDVLLFTSDGYRDAMITGGKLPDVLETMNFGSRASEAFSKLKEYQPNGPRFCMEFWNGWFDHWGEKHHTRDVGDVIETLEYMIKSGASVNFYMFHGGTNFGFYNGANYGEKYDPTITSYDYDAILNESGEPTGKFYAVKDLIEKYKGKIDVELPEPIEKIGYGKVELSEQALLLDCLKNVKSISTVCPETMERLGQDYGFILYEAHVSGPREEGELILQEVHDRGQVFVNGEYLGVIDRWSKDQSIKISIPKEGAKLQILVENMGRINYGPYLLDRKGITEGVRLNYQYIFHWRTYPLPMKELSWADFNPLKSKEGPGFYKGSFNIESVSDTFLELPGFEKGVVLINGFNIGRYWNVGPQRTLYVPGPLLNKGENEIIVFELHGIKDPVVYFRDSDSLN